MEEGGWPPCACIWLPLPWTSACSWEGTSCCQALLVQDRAQCLPAQSRGALPSLTEGEYIDYQIPVTVNCVFMPVFQYEEELNQENVIAEVWTPHIWELEPWRVLIQLLIPACPKMILHALNHPVSLVSAVLRRLLGELGSAGRGQAGTGR